MDFLLANPKNSASMPGLQKLTHALPKKVLNCIQYELDSFTFNQKPLVFSPHIRCVVTYKVMFELV